MTPSVNTEKNYNNILILDKVPTQGLENSALTAEAEYSINFSNSQRKFCLWLHYNGVISFLFLNTPNIYQFKAQNFEITPYPLCLGSLSKDFTANNIKK